MGRRSAFNALRHRIRSCRFVNLLRQTSNILHRQSKTRYFEAKALRIILPCLLFFLFSLATNLYPLWAAPTAVDDPNYSVIEDHELLVNDPNQGVLNNDTGVNTNLKIQVIDNVDNGTLVILDPYKGFFSYDPNNNFNVVHSFVSPGTGSLLPWGVACDEKTLYIGDGIQDAIFKTDTLGNILATLPSGGPLSTGLGYRTSELWNSDLGDPFVFPVIPERMFKRIQSRR